MKVQVQRTFKGYFFCHQKNNEKADRLCMKFSSAFNTSVQRCLYPLFQNQRPHFLLLHLFQRMSQPSVQDLQYLNEHMVDYHPSPSEFTSKIHHLIFLWTPKGFISLEYFLIFFPNLYIPPWLKIMFQIHGVKITGKHISESKNWICSFLLMVPSKTLPQVFIITTPGRRKLPISPKQSFLKIYFTPADRERTMELKIWPKLNLEGYWLQFLIYFAICNLYIFGFCFIVT